MVPSTHLLLVTVLCIAFAAVNARDCGQDNCIAVHKCRSIMDHIRKLPKPIPEAERKKMLDIQCGQEGKFAKICCPDKSTSVLGKSKLLPNSCGRIDTTNKIVGGMKTGIFEFPWMALISYRTAYGVQFQCGGTILNEKYILTAAHCISDKILGPRRLKVESVRVGEHDFSKEKDCETFHKVTTCAPPYQEFKIEQLISHEKFNPILNADRVNFNHDIGLIRLSGKIDLNQENTKAVCLPFRRDISSVSINNKRTVIGFGATEFNINSPALLKAILEKVPLDQCQKQYKRNKLNAEITGNQLCAGGKNNTASCPGDSGGPLHLSYFDAQSGDAKYVQEGIVSVGPKNCGAEGYPGLYTRVERYMDWILNNLEA